MPTLSAHSNVENTAYHILKDKGYQLWNCVDTELCCAEKNGWDFMADSLVSLLGIISIYEHLEPKEYKEYWWQTSKPWLCDSLPKEPLPFSSAMVRRNQ